MFKYDMTENTQDELSLIDIVGFIKRQFKNIFMLFIIFFGIGCAFIFTRPTLFESRADLKIGSILFLADKNIESVEMVKYRADNVNVAPIKNTTVVQITARNADEITSRNLVEGAIVKITQEHEKLFEEKREQFIQLMTLSQNSNKKEFISIMDMASSSSKTKQIGDITTTRLAFGGILSKGLAIAFFLSAFLALVFGLLIDNSKKIKSLFQ